MSVLAYILDALVPPRTSEQLVRTLEVDDLHALSINGMLPYHDPRVTALVWELKYHAHKRAVRLAGEFLAEHVLAVAGEELGAPLLIPVPMHPARRKTRGYNQTELLCQSIIHYNTESVVYTPTALKRVVDTRPQQGLERHKRLHNVHNSMVVTDPTSVRERVCIVVDDVTTTGATFDEARRALRSAGARRVHTIALAQS